MFRNIGTTEILIIVTVLLVLFGGKKLPELGRGIGDTIKEFKKALSGKENKEDK
ncbi:MAG: twin-arginine translocase TatA/TatE family subunit [Candidatus Shapirobacteria bacterium]